MLVHCITSSLMGYETAQLVAAMGASPIMTEDWREFGPLYQGAGGNGAAALLANLGMPDRRKYKAIRKAAGWACRQGVPVVLDPVGCHSSIRRLKFAKQLAERGRVSLIKCNTAEAKALLGLETSAAGIDNEAADSRVQASLAASLAETYAVPAIVTGRWDAAAEPAGPAMLCGGEAPGEADARSRVGRGCLLGAAAAVAYARAQASREPFPSWCRQLLEDFRAERMEGTDENRLRNHT